MSRIKKTEETTYTIELDIEEAQTLKCFLEIVLTENLNPHYDGQPLDQQQEVIRHICENLPTAV